MWFPSGDREGPWEPGLPGRGLGGGECTSSQKSPDHPATFSPRFRGWSIMLFIFHIQNWRPTETRAGRGIGVIQSALGASGRRLVITSRKGCYRRQVCRPGWGGRAGSTLRTGRRGPHTQPACSSRAGTQRTGRKESHTGWACRSLAGVWLACNSRAGRSPGRGWT